jgi:hypothetical protein
MIKVSVTLDRREVEVFLSEHALEYIDIGVKYDPANAKVMILDDGSAQVDLEVE